MDEPVRCESEDHRPNDTVVTERPDPWNGRTRVRWCADCHDHEAASWDAYLTSMENPSDW